MHHPALLLASAADARNIILVSGKLEFTTLFAIALPRRLIGMVGSYGLGVLFGRRVLSWSSKTLPRVTRLIQFLERTYRRFPRATLLLWPAYATSILAGLVRVPHRTFVPVMIAGQIAFVLTCFYLGEAASGWVDQLIQFFRERLWQSTAIFASLVLLQQLAAYRRRQRRQTEPPV